MATPTSNNKRDRPSDNTPPARPKKTKTTRRRYVQENIEADESVNVEGENAVYCEGQCNFWLHRKCVGLTKQAYIEIGSSEDPYICPHCTMAYYRKEIVELKNLVKSLSEKLKVNTSQSLQSVESVTSDNISSTPSAATSSPVSFFNEIEKNRSL